MNENLKTKFILFIAYTNAIIFGWFTITFWIHTESILLNIFIADFAACVVIYMYCIMCDSFSINDPYWNLQTLLIMVYYCFMKDDFINELISNPRIIMIIVLVSVWSIRASVQVVQAIHHYRHEDWHYSFLSEKLGSHGFMYYVQGFVPFVVVPTVIVYFACSVPMYYAIYVYEVSKNGFNLFDILAFLLTVTGILFEVVADAQLKAFTSKQQKEGAELMSINSGLWLLCRHPNYFGELAFWFGLYAFGLAAGGGSSLFYLLCFFVGPFAIYSLIYFGSLPMMEERLMKRRKNTYSIYVKQIPNKLIPNLIKLF